MRKFIGLLILAFVASAYAVSIWYGASAAGKWSTAANWKGGVAPAAGEYAVFDGDSCGAVICSLDVPVSIASIAFKANYAGTFKQKAQAVTLTDSLSWKSTGGTIIYDGQWNVTGNVDLINSGVHTTNAGACMAMLGTGHVNSLRTQINWDSLYVAHTAQKCTVSVGSGGTQRLALGTGLYSGTFTIKPVANGSQIFYSQPTTTYGDNLGVIGIVYANTANAKFTFGRIVTSGVSGSLGLVATSSGNLDTLSLTDSIVMRTITIVPTTSAFTLITNNKNITALRPSTASILIGTTAIPVYIVCGSSIISSLFNQVDFTDGGIAPAAPDTVHGGTSQWFFGTGLTLSSKTYIDETPTFNFTTNGASTITSNGASMWHAIINKTAGTAVTFADRFRIKGNLTITAGKPTYAASARDSIVGDYANNLTGTDTLNRNSDSLWLGGSFTGNLRTKNDLSRSYLYGSALCNFTTNGATVNYFDIRGTDRTKQMKLIDRCRIRKVMVTTGTLNTNGKTCMADSFIVVQDSIATVLGDTITAPKIKFGATAKPMLSTPMLLYFGLALKDTLFDTCARSLGKLVVNKSGDTLTLAGVMHMDTLQVTDGGLRMSNATDTVYCKGLSWTSTDPSTIIAPIVVSGNISVAVGASITATGVGKIVSTGTGSTIALNGCTGVPPIQINDHTSLTGGGTIARFIFGVDGKKATWQTAKLFNFTAIDTANWNGVSGSLDSMVSSNATDACTLGLPANNTYSNMYFRDCITLSPDTLKCPWRNGCRSGGGNF